MLKNRRARRKRVPAWEELANNWAPLVCAILGLVRVVSMPFST